MSLCTEKECCYFGKEQALECGCVTGERAKQATDTSALGLLDRAANTIDALTNIAGHSLARHQIKSAREIAAALREAANPAAPATARFAIPEFLRKQG